MGNRIAYVLSDDGRMVAGWLGASTELTDDRVGQWCWAIPGPKATIAGSDVTERQLRAPQSWTHWPMLETTFNFTDASMVMDTATILQTQYANVMGIEDITSGSVVFARLNFPNMFQQVLTDTGYSTVGDDSSTEIRTAISNLVKKPWKWGLPGGLFVLKSDGTMEAVLGDIPTWYQLDNALDRTMMPATIVNEDQTKVLLGWEHFEDLVASKLPEDWSTWGSPDVADTVTITQAELAAKGVSIDEATLTVDVKQLYRQFADLSDLGKTDSILDDLNGFPGSIGFRIKAYAIGDDKKTHLDCSSAIARMLGASDYATVDENNHTVTWSVTNWGDSVEPLVHIFSKMANGGLAIPIDFSQMRATFTNGPTTLQFVLQMNLALFNGGYQFDLSGRNFTYKFELHSTEDAIFHNRVTHNYIKWSKAFAPDDDDCSCKDTYCQDGAPLLTKAGTGGAIGLSLFDSYSDDYIYKNIRRIKRLLKDTVSNQRLAIREYDTVIRNVRRTTAFNKFSNKSEYVSQERLLSRIAVELLQVTNKMSSFESTIGSFEPDLDYGNSKNMCIIQMTKPDVDDIYSRLKQTSIDITSVYDFLRSNLIDDETTKELIANDSVPVDVSFNYNAMTAADRDLATLNTALTEIRPRIPDEVDTTPINVSTDPSTDMPHWAIYLFSALGGVILAALIAVIVVKVKN